MSNPLNETRIRRPFAISVIAVVEALFGIPFLIGGITGLFAVIFVSNAAHTSASQAVTNTEGSVLILFSVILIFLGLGELFLSQGLWRLRPWALRATIILQVISIANTLLQWVTHTATSSSLVSLIINLVIQIVIVIYLISNRKVRAAFNGA